MIYRHSPYTKQYTKRSNAKYAVKAEILSKIKTFHYSANSYVTCVMSIDWWSFGIIKAYVYDVIGNVVGSNKH